MTINSTLYKGSVIELTATGVSNRMNNTMCLLPSDKAVAVLYHHAGRCLNKLCLLF